MLREEEGSRPACRPNISTPLPVWSASWCGFGYDARIRIRDRTSWRTRPQKAIAAIRVRRSAPSRYRRPQSVTVDLSLLVCKRKDRRGRLAGWGGVCPRPHWVANPTPGR